ncbi:MAG TPA: N-acetylmuramoyl-L-alanine amidase [Myxococcales bacterium]|nr:N-acetylmuramoyl-L-alanine amidase [Myxococcales bacterium]
MRLLLVVLTLATLPAAAKPVPAGAVQARKLEAGNAALEKLRADPRRRRYRDGWEAVLRTFDGAVKAAPHGRRAPEAALAAARARVELWEVSRSPMDARAAIAALRKVDEDYPGPAGVQALAAALRLAGRANDSKERAAAARRLAERYPQDAKAIAPAASAVAEPPIRTAAEPARASGAVLPAKSSAAAAAPAQKNSAAVPATAPKSSAAAAATASKSSAAAAAAAQKSSTLAEAQKPIESDDDEEEVDGQAARAVEQIVEAAKARATARSDDAGADDGDEEEAPEPEAPANPPSRSPPIVRAVKTAVAALTEPEDAPAQAAKARQMRSTALGAGTSLGAQLGLKVRRVVVDAGHGGKDTGAIGPRGVREKDLALAIAKKLAARLRQLGFEVILTRKSDVFLSLDERTRIANEARADLFLSIHCNAARRRKLEGVETWTLNVASDRYAARLAAFENAEADRTVSDLRLILADLATKANASDARDLAQSVQSSLIRTLRSRVGRVRDHGVKQALFYVLLGTRMPSILVETGFISNPAEELRLKSARFQTGAAEAIARGVKDYVESRRRLARAP